MYRIRIALFADVLLCQLRHPFSQSCPDQVLSVNFTFLHAADLHLGSPFTGLAIKDATVAKRFAEASRAAFAELIRRAILEQVAFVVISGDVYDGDWKDMGIGLFFNREVARLTRAGINVYLVRGNHDAESEITKAVPLPEGVRLLSSRKPETVRIEALNVAIHGRSFTDRAVTENVAVTYPPAIAGSFNIGLLHTSCEGNSQHATYAPCSISDLVGRGYDYWALGHVHQFQVLCEDPWIVYPGNLQGRSVRECGPKGAVLVDVADGRVSQIRHLIVDQGRFLHETVDVSESPDAAHVLDVIRQALQAPLASTGEMLAAVRVTLRGETALDAMLRARMTGLRDDAQAVLHHLHPDAWLESLKLATSPAKSTVDIASVASGLDPESLLADLQNDVEIRSTSEQFLAQISNRLPGGMGVEALGDLDALLSDARALAAMRALGREA